MKAAGRPRAPHHDNVIRVPAERWQAKRLRSDYAPERSCAPVSRIRYDDDAPDDAVPEPRPAMRGQLVRATTSADAAFYILIRIREVAGGEAAFWEIGMLPSVDDDADPFALRFAEDIGWHAVRETAACGYVPARFHGAMSTRDIRREALRRCETLARTIPGYDDPGVIEEMLLHAHVLPVTRMNALIRE